MPETARLLSRHPIEWFAFSWGLGTLTHADTAGELWRAGVGQASLCEATARGLVGRRGADKGGARRRGGRAGGSEEAGGLGPAAPAKGRASPPRRAGGGGSAAQRGGRRAGPRPDPAAAKPITVETVSVKVLTVTNLELATPLAHAVAANGGAAKQRSESTTGALRPAVQL
jgi:hypothetical protein